MFVATSVPATNQMAAPMPTADTLERWEGEKIAQEQFFYDPEQFVRG
jgi:hypothetical protein